ncbi:hypothetical protein Tco_0633839 [Tanacetum coccineum]
MAIEVPSNLKYRGGQLNVAPLLEVENFINWKKRFMCHISGIEPQFENIIKNGPYILMAAGQRKPKVQWSADERKTDNLDQRLKSLIMSVLPDDQMNSIINCLIAKSTWDDLILYQEGPSDVKESDLASLFGKLKYEENLIDSIYDNENKKALTTETPYQLPSSQPLLSRTSKIVLMMKRIQEADFQDSPDDEEDTRSSQEYLNNLEEEYQAKSILAKSKRFFKKGSQRSSSTRQLKILNVTNVVEMVTFLSHHKTESKDFESKYNKFKAKLALLSPGASASSSTLVKNKGLIDETCEWDEEDVSSDDNEVMEVKALMALAEEERVFVSKECARNGEWVHISIRKHANTEILKDNKNLRNELNELKSITKTWLNSFKQVNQCINEQIPSQKKRILGVDQLTEDPSSSGHKDLVFIKSSAYNTKVSIPCVERPWLSEAEGFILSNRDTSRIPPAESQRNSTDPPVVVIDSLETEYDSANKSLVCSTSFPPLEKPDDAETVSGPKTVKTTLKSISTFKTEALKGIIPNEPSSAPAQETKMLQLQNLTQLLLKIQRI